MTADETKAHEICREVEARMGRMGVVVTAHFEAGVPLIAAALREEREACLRLVELSAEKCLNPANAASAAARDIRARRGETA